MSTNILAQLVLDICFAFILRPYLNRICICVLEFQGDNICFYSSVIMFVIGCRELGLPIKSSEVRTTVGSERKKKRKGERSKRKSVEGDGNSCSHVASGVDIQQDELKMDNAVNTVCGEKQETE